MKNSVLKILSYKRKILCLPSEISSTNFKTKNLQVEISELKSKTENLMKTVFKFTKGKENSG